MVENFNQLTKYTADKLERVGLSMVFAVAPERAAEIYPEEAKRLADVNDILNDMGLDEGKKKVKLDRNYLTSLITEVLTEVEGPHSDLLLQLDNPDFVKQGVELLATSQAMFIDDMWHNKLENEPVKDFNWREMMFKLMDEYVFIMESRKEAERLAEMLKDFYENKGLWAEDGTKKVTSIVADSHNYGDHRVMMDVDKE